MPTQQQKSLDGAAKVEIPRRQASEMLTEAGDRAFLAKGDYILGLDRTRDIEVWANTALEGKAFAVNGVLTDFRNNMPPLSYSAWVWLMHRFFPALSDRPHDSGRSEKWYVSEFVKWAASGGAPYFLERSSFVESLELEYDPDQGKPSRKSSEPGARNIEIDLIERDSSGRHHLWEAKVLSSKEWSNGKVVGQLMEYDWRLRSMGHSALQSVLDRKSGTPGVFDARSIIDYGFSSWNIMVAGGFGYELAAMINPGHWDIVAVENYLDPQHARPIAQFHFFETLDFKSLEAGWWLENALRSSLLTPELMHPSAWENYLIDIADSTSYLEKLWTDPGVMASVRFARSAPWLEGVGRGTNFDIFVG